MTLGYPTTTEMVVVSPKLTLCPKLSFSATWINFWRVQMLLRAYHRHHRTSKHSKEVNWNGIFGHTAWEELSKSAELHQLIHWNQVYLKAISAENMQISRKYLLERYFQVVGRYFADHKYLGAVPNILDASERFPPQFQSESRDFSLNCLGFGLLSLHFAVIGRAILNHNSHQKLRILFGHGCRTLESLKTNYFGTYNCF